MNEIEFALATTNTLSSNQRLHHIVKAERTANIRIWARVAMGSEGFTPMSHAHCFCYLSFSDNRRRDANNYWPTAKAVIDGFVDAGLLPDDDHLHLVGPDMRIDKSHGTRGIVKLRFEFTEITK